MRPGPAVLVLLASLCAPTQDPASRPPRPMLEPVVMTPAQTVAQSRPASQAASRRSASRPTGMIAVTRVTQRPESTRDWIAMEDGSWCEALNGAQDPPGLVWPAGVPFSRAVGKVKDAQGLWWYVHEDGSRSTAVASGAVTTAKDAEKTTWSTFVVRDVADGGALLPAELVDKRPADPRAWVQLRDELWAPALNGAKGALGALRLELSGRGGWQPVVGRRRFSAGEIYVHADGSWTMTVASGGMPPETSRVVHGGPQPGR